MRINKASQIKNIAGVFRTVNKLYFRPVESRYYVQLLDINKIMKMIEEDTLDLAFELPSGKIILRIIKDGEVSLISEEYIIDFYENS